MKNVFKYAIVALVAFIAGSIATQMICPSYDTYLEKSYKDISLSRLDIIRAQDNLLHQVYVDNRDYWYDVLMETDAYIELDSIRDYYWEDFYYIDE